MYMKYRFLYVTSLHVCFNAHLTLLSDFKEVNNCTILFIRMLSFYKKKILCYDKISLFKIFLIFLQQTRQNQEPHYWLNRKTINSSSCYKSLYYRVCRP